MISRGQRRRKASAMPEEIEVKMTDLEFCAAARQAFDIMMRRQWHPQIFGDKKWGVAYARCQHIGGFDDPFTALIETEKHVASEEASCSS